MNPLKRTPKFFALFWVLLLLTFSLWAGQGRTQTQSSMLPAPDFANRDGPNKEEAKLQPVGGFDFGWKEGIRLGYQYKDVFRLNSGDNSMSMGDTSQPTRRCRMPIRAPIHRSKGGMMSSEARERNWLGPSTETIEVKVEVEFAQTRELKDAWIASKKKIPVIGYVRAGNMKEPFSLEELTGDPEITFMERSLPTQAFSPDRNVGLMLNNTVLNERITWAAGGFYNTGDLNNVYKGGDPQDKWNTANGYSLAARVTGLPWYEESGKGLLHLGVSYNFRARNVNKDGAEEKFSSRPESYLTNEKFVNTGNITCNPNKSDRW